MNLARHPRMLFCIALTAILLLATTAVLAEEYLGHDEFLSMAFGNSAPEMQTLWLTREARSAAKATVGWSPAALRVRYWRHSDSTAWILEDIGKDKPITLGVVVTDHRIQRVEVLAFRESRGWEIRYPFFTSQFSGLSLSSEGQLSQHIDGITGATLSVHAVERVARMALWLDAQVQG